MDNRKNYQRSRVLRTDGKLMNIVHHRGHLMVCATGCCCGHVDRGYAPVPTDLYHREWEGRKLRNRVHLTQAGCLGPCTLANVVMLTFDGQPVWFQSVNTEHLIVAIYDYIEKMLAADKFLPPPPELADYVFDFYTWSPNVERSTTPQEVAPTGILLLTHADTDLLALASAIENLPTGFPPVDGFNLLALKNDSHMIEMIAERVDTAEVVVLRLLGKPSSVPGFSHLLDAVRQQGKQLIVVSGTGSLEPELTAMSTVNPAIVHEVLAYFEAGGAANTAHMLRFLADHLLMGGFGYDTPQEQPQHGIYHPDLPVDASLADWRAQFGDKPAVGILFYRSHWMSGNTTFVDALVREIEAGGAVALPIFTASPRIHTAAENVNGLAVGRFPEAFQLLIDENGKPLIDVLLNTISFAMGDINPDGATLSTWSAAALEALDIPVLQAINASTAKWQWENAARGLNPLDTAMNVAMPEFDGRIITVPITFKERKKNAGGCADPNCAGCSLDAPFEVLHYEPVPDRVRLVVQMALRFVALRRKPNAAKRIAFILTNSSGKAAKIGNAVGLDAPASLINTLHAMQTAGYRIEDLPADGDTLIQTLIDRCSYDEIFLTPDQLAQAAGQVNTQHYTDWFAQLPANQRGGITRQWGAAPGEAYLHDDHIALAGLALGNVFVALQPPRGYGMDPNAIYHQPDLPPPHNYYALYRWLRDEWGADAIVHMGKHGTLEWLPGKGVGLSAECYPDTFLADLPLFYPFILNDPGEGAQAKRRAHAVILDHLTPPMTTAEGYGDLAQLMQLVDEYYQVEMLDPTKLPLLQQQIWALIKQTNLDTDLAAMLRQDHGDHVHEWDAMTTADGTPVTLAEMQGREVAHLIEDIDAYLCELAGAQIRDGLHILGSVPQGEQMIGLLFALTRLANLDVPSLRASVAAAFGLNLEDVLANLGKKLAPIPPDLERLADRPLFTHADALEVIDELAHHVLALLQVGDFAPNSISNTIQQTFTDMRLPNQAAADLNAVLGWVCQQLVPVLGQTTDEITHLLRGLNGGYVPAGPSGAPTRGMAHVLPTGRNFYAVDPRSLPSMAAWEVGQGLAREVLERHLRESGTYPESVGISIWGTSAMRTHGDDVAEVLALLGVRPVWHTENHRVTGVELIPLVQLGRPRIDVTVRISGFFRDAFPHLIKLLDDAFKLVMDADEFPEQNYPRKHYLTDLAHKESDGIAAQTAQKEARYRVFGSKPGTYGAGILPLIDERNWQDDADFATAYVNWGGYAYTADEQGTDARPTFRHRLSLVEVALHNQDNREHDIFDSDDYLQFHGGMIATIRALTGKQPRHYFGDTQDPNKPAVRDLKEETLRVFRSRVVNPKWIESIQRHGYKGGLELATTVDYLFGYDATAQVMEDFMYEDVAQHYALDPTMQDFLTQSNPWALHAIAERLLEAAERGMWKAPRPETLDGLRGVYLSTDEALEGR